MPHDGSTEKATKRPREGEKQSTFEEEGHGGSEPRRYVQEKSGSAATDFVPEVPCVQR